MLKNKIEELTSHEHSLKVILEYDLSYVTCILKRPYCKHLGVRAVAGNDTDALDKALKLLKEVEELEEKVGDLKSPQDEQFDERYYREIVFEDYEVECCGYGGCFVITDISRKEPSGYYLVKKPYDPTKRNDMRKVEKECEESKEESKYLNSDEELWEWDNIRFLSGSAGYAIVKDGKVIKTKMMIIS